ncbi:MAG: DUF2971 domain-containing protein [Syntrophales bacterium]
MNAKPIKSPPDRLYHYTSQRGLQGIIGDKKRDTKIWSTNLRYLNDSTEFSYAISLTKDVLKGRPAEIEDFIWDILLSHLSSLEAGPVFVTSLSSRRDQLSQWRGYCPDSGGFMIGFDREELHRVAKEQGFELARCEYSLDEQRRIINKEIEVVSHVIHPENSYAGANPHIELDEYFKTVGKARLNFALRLLFVAPRFKHPSFMEEDEWRLISDPTDKRPREIMFREGKSMIVPYIKFFLSNKIDGMPIKEVMVGPTPHPDLSLNSVGELLADKGISCTLSKSEVPFRAW